MRLFLTLLLFLATSFLIQGSFAADRIVAVVNDQVITYNQLQSRAELNLRQVGIANPTAQQRDAVTKRSLSNLIDEELQRQYATQAGLSLGKQERADAIAMVRKNMGEATWKQLTGGLQTAAEEKIAAEALWQRIIASQIQPRVQVSTPEADRLIAELAKSRKVEDREISIIMLEASPDADANKAKLQILTELKAKTDEGESFSDLARAHSDDHSAVNGGKLGWFGSGELNPQLEESLDSLTVGQVSNPIRTPDGWYLVRLDNVRTASPVDINPQTQLELFLLAIPASPEKADMKAQQAALETTTSKLKTRDDVAKYFSEEKFKEAFPASASLGWVTQADLDEELAKAIGKTKPGNWTKTVTVNGNATRIFIADTRQAMADKLAAYRDRVLKSMYGNRVELESRRFLQNLRQRAFLDIRL